MPKRKRYRAGEEWKRTLEPWARLYGIAFGAMTRHLARLSDERLEELVAATKMPSQTNCGWTTYAVAEILAREAKWEQRTRRQVAEHYGPWRDRHGDVWQLGDDGLMHTPETIPFKREYVEKKWGPLVSVLDEATNHTNGSQS